MKKLTKIKSYVLEVVTSFINDPADTKYQAGYEACAKDMLQEIYRIEDSDA